MDEFLAQIRADGTLESAAKASSAPFAYAKDGEAVGYGADIMVRFCKAYGYGLNLHNVELASFIAGIEAEKYDLGAAGFTVTEERAERVYFSRPDYGGGIVAVAAADKAVRPGSRPFPALRAPPRRL